MYGNEENNFEGSINENIGADSSSNMDYKEENNNYVDDNYPRDFQQDDQYYNDKINYTNSYYDESFKQNKAINKENKKRGRKKFIKGFAKVAGIVLVAFVGGMAGGYLGNINNKSTSDLSMKVDPSAYAPPEFLSSNDNGNLTVAEAIQKVKPSVVTISTKTIVSSGNRFIQDSVQEGIGSGFIINEEGYIITNYHVVEGSTEVTVLLSTGEEVGATVVNYDQEKDIAMVKLDDGVKVPGVAELGDSDALYAGQEVIAIGTPLSTEFTATSTKGIVSAINRNVQADTGVTINLIQTDAAINPGNSGGPLINTKGQVIGINSMKLVTTEVEGIGFAIPINEAADRIETLSKPIITLGITIIEITDELSKENDLPKGLYVSDISDFSSAQKGGIKIGDVITSFDGKDILSADDLSAAKEEKEIGDVVKVIVIRDDKKVELEITLE